MMRLYLAAWFFFMAPYIILANEDSLTQAVPDTLHSGDGDNGGELILEEIDIQGVVDQPGVIFFPKRIEPELGDVDLERSFGHELRGSALDVKSPVENADDIQRVKSVKKQMEKEREKNKHQKTKTK